MLCILFLLDGQNCTDSVDIRLNGDDQLRNGRLAIVPHLNFTCNGRITNIRAKLGIVTISTRFPYIQIWRPSSPGSVTYTKIDEVQLQFSQIILISLTRPEANITLTGDNRIEFQSRDVVGYYHPSNAPVGIRTINTRGYIQYEFNGSPTLTSVDLSTVADNRINNERQPLIQFMISKL